MKIAKVIIDPNMSQIKMGSHADLKKLAKKADMIIIEGPEFDFIILSGALYFAKKK